MTWVDGSDQAWRQEKAKYSNAGETDGSEDRMSPYSREKKVQKLSEVFGAMRYMLS